MKAPHTAVLLGQRQHLFHKSMYFVYF